MMKPSAVAVAAARNGAASTRAATDDSRHGARSKIGGLPSPGIRLPHAPRRSRAAAILRPGPCHPANARPPVRAPERERRRRLLLFRRRDRLREVLALLAALPAHGFEHGQALLGEV